MDWNSFLGAEWDANFKLFCLGKRRYNIKLWKTFTDCFNCLPVAAIIDEKIFCCHGGLSPDLQSMEQIRRIMRPTDVPDQGLLCDLLWSDPDKDVAGAYGFFCWTAGLKQISLHARGTDLIPVLLRSVGKKWVEVGACCIYTRNSFATTKRELFVLLVIFGLSRFVISVAMVLQTSAYCRCWRC